MDEISSGIVVVSSGVTSTGLMVLQDGVMQVMNAGFAQETGIADGGKAVVSNGGILYVCTVSSGGTATVLNGGFAQDITVENGGLYLVSSGGTAHKSVLQSGGTQIVSADVMAASITVMNGGILHVSSGAYARTTVISQGGSLYLWKGGLSDRAQIYGGLEVNANAAANSATVFAGGQLFVLSAGNAYKPTVSSGGVLDAASGGVVNSAIVYDGGTAMISAGASGFNAKINGGAVILAGETVPGDPGEPATPGGYMSNATVNSGGRLIISSGATAVKVMENGGYVQVADGANVTFSSNTISDLTLSGASATIHSGTTANNTTVNGGGRLEVFSGGTAADVLENGGCVEIAEGAAVTFASNTISGLELAGSATVHSGTTVNSAMVNSGGGLEVFSGGKLTGQMIFAEGATVSAGEDAILDFNIAKLTPESGARVNNLAIIQGTPVYTLTVSADQTKGVYTLAEGAAEFNGAITVQNASGESLGTLTVDNPLVTEDTVYTLNLGTETAADALSLTVKQNDTTPSVITLTADTETVLKQTTLTATVDDGSEIYFRISESGAWKKYTGPIIASFNETYYFKATDESGNEGTNQITFGNIDTSGIMLSTLWAQKGVCPMGGNTTVCYNEYTPYDPTVTPDTHSLVGCTNIAAGQLIYYFIEKQGLDLALTLEKSDEYTSKHKAAEGGEKIVIEIKSDGSTPGTLSFAAINEYLSDFKLDSAEHAAALLYACGVAHKSKYAAVSTGATWSNSIFTRFGFKCVNIDGPYMGMGYYYWGYWDDDLKIHISDAGYEVLIENLEAGRPVGAAYHGHALVIDGYDREDDTFHINFGWAYNQATRWYTREEVFELQFQEFVYDLMVDYVETFTVTDARLYGTGTMLRAFEQAAGMAGANTVVFDSSVAGKTVELLNGIRVKDETTVNGFNMNVLIISTYGDETPACGFNSGTGDILTFHASGGSLIVSTSNEYNHAFDMSEALSGTVTADNTLIYAGKTSEGADAAAVLQSLQESRSGNTEVSEDLLDPNGWSYFGSAGNDVFTLSNSSIAVGNVTLGDGDDVLSLAGHSRLYGTIDAGDGDDSITVDSTSTISGDLSGKCNLSFVLTEMEDHVLFTIKKSVSDLYSNATLSVDVTDAKTGTYTLVSAASGATGIEDLQNMVFTVVCSGAPAGTLAAGETLSVGETDYTLSLNEAILTLAVETVKPVPPVPDNPVGTKDRVSWDPAGTGGYVVEYSTDNFAHGLRAAAATNAVDMLALPAGTYQWRVKLADGDQWADGNEIKSDNTPEPAKVLRSNEDGSGDLFFASPVGTWENIFYAQHVGSVSDWAGTKELVSASGKNRIADLFFGSDDANILCLTDDENGDGIFVDDEFTVLPESITEQQARIARISEIRAGAGDDIVDMTSQRLEYIGDGLTIRGGDGSDTIWANKGDNQLFGDAGNDRIVGASGDDVIAGGAGNDRMHGGGGNDVFTFGENWGNDIVHQLGTGTVTLWFASGGEANWDAETMIYTDGDNSVAVSGVTVDKITLKFGDDGSARYAALAQAGAFLGFTSERIFEEQGGGILASL